jgi:RNA polymerase sigma factor (sigma-70 family)
MERYDDIYRLATEARGGDLDALSRLVDSVRMRLSAIAFSVSENYADAQDAVAGAVVEICLHIGDLREPRVISAWMRRIVRREALRIRGNRRAAPLTDCETDHGAGAIQSVLRIDVERALHHLPATHSRAIRLFYFEALSLGEIAAEMSLPDTPVNVGQVKTWLHRAKQQLAVKMKGYDDMKPKTVKPKMRRAAIVCSDLSQDMISALSGAMRSGGLKAEVISGKDLPGLTRDDSAGPSSIWSKGHIAQSTALTGILKRYEALVFDEQVVNRTGLELSLFCKSSADTVRIPITLLHSHPADAVFIQACATVGVLQLIDKSDPESIASSFRPADGRGDIWRRFSDDARQVVYFCQEEAAKLRENFVSTEHMLLGLMRDPACPGAKILDTGCGTSLDTVRVELSKHLQNGPGRNEALDMQLTPRCKRVVDLAVEEANLAGRKEVGSEHILLGLIAEDRGLAGTVLAALDVNLDKARSAVAEGRLLAQR